MKILTLSDPDDPLAYAIASAFHDCFTELGHQSSLQKKYASGFDLCLVMYAHVWYGLPKDSTYKIAYNWEDVHNPMWRKAIHRSLGQFNCIWEHNLHNLNIALPVKRLVCPVGYHKSFELEKVNGPAHNIALVGYVERGKHRNGIIDLIEQRLNQKVWCIRTKVDWANACNKRLNEILFNSRIHLNIHRNTKYRLFESVRVISQLLSNGCFVISEPSINSPLIHGIHYIESTDFPGTIEYYLKHPEECAHISQQGYEFVKNNYKLVDFVFGCLKQVGV